MAQSDSYGNIVDIKVLRGLIGTDWLNMSVLMKSGAMTLDPRPLDWGTQFTSVRNKLLQDTTAGGQTGQAIGIGSTVTFAERTQTEIVTPVVQRATGAIIDTVQEMIQAGGPGKEEELALEIREWAAEAVDTLGVRILEGAIASVTENLLDTSGSGDITLDAINQARYKRGDYADRFKGGLFIAHSHIMQDLKTSGLVAFTSNTWGTQNTQSTDGVIPLVQGMQTWTTDKLAQEGGVFTGGGSVDYYTYMLEPGALVVRGQLLPVIQDDGVENGFGRKIKVMIRIGIALRGIGYSGAQGDIITDADLNSSANWSNKLMSAKHVPAVRLQTT